MKVLWFVVLFGVHSCVSVYQVLMENQLWIVIHSHQCQKFHSQLLTRYLTLHLRMCVILPQTSALPFLFAQHIQYSPTWAVCIVDEGLVVVASTQVEWDWCTTCCFLCPFGGWVHREVEKYRWLDYDSRTELLLCESSMFWRLEKVQMLSASVAFLDSTFLLQQGHSGIIAILLWHFWKL